MSLQFKRFLALIFISLLPITSAFAEVNTLGEEISVLDNDVLDQEINKLNALNHADKKPVTGFNRGGPVGSIQEYATGGTVQRLFIGGLLNPPPAARP